MEVRLYTNRVSHFRKINEEMWDIHYTLIIFLFKFHVLLMQWKNELWNLLTFHVNSKPGTKCCEMWNVKKRRQNMKKVTCNEPLYNFCFFTFREHFLLFCDKCIAGPKKRGNLGLTTTLLTLWIVSICLWYTFHIFHRN